MAASMPQTQDQTQDQAQGHTFENLERFWDYVFNNNPTPSPSPIGHDFWYAPNLSLPITIGGVVFDQHNKSHQIDGWLIEMEEIVDLTPGIGFTCTKISPTTPLA